MKTKREELAEKVEALIVETEAAMEVTPNGFEYACLGRMLAGLRQAAAMGRAKEN